MSSHEHTRTVFLKCLAVVYFIAFASLAPQALGLWGSRGILPATEFLSAARAEVSGPSAYWFFPTVFWIQSTDIMLLAVCVLGSLFSILIFFDLVPAIFLFLDWFLYLSFVTVGGDFMSFQWDSLLLEAGFLAIFFAPWKAGEKTSVHILWLFRWLIFRLIFFSGFSKLASGDLTWRNLTALTFHYQTQPLPPWTAWTAHHLPAWIHAGSCVMMFAIELGAPFLIFMGRRPRALACAGFIFLQGLLILTGNYGIFNWLSIILCFLLLDDGAFAFLGEVPVVKKSKPAWVAVPLCVLILLLSLNRMTFGHQRTWPESLRHARAQILLWTESWSLVNSYGLFAVMTTQRPEIILEGSDDGEHWFPYEFKYKPGDPQKKPAFVAPYHPRLDWQMWFAALGSPQDNPWFLRFCERILEGSRPVLRLLKNNPFPVKPPRVLRAILYDYRFSDPTTLKAKGQWWVREEKGLYIPILKKS